MTAKLAAIVLVLAACYGIYYLLNSYKDMEQKQAVTQPAAPLDPSAGGSDPNVTSESLAGLPQRMEASLKNAYAQGATGLGNWLKTNRNYVVDPRRAAIELDYAALLSRTDPEAAKKIFTSVKARTPVNSPVYGRVKKLEPLYQ